MPSEMVLLSKKKEQVLKLQFQLCEKNIFLHKEKQTKKKLEKIFQDVKRCLSLGGDNNGEFDDFSCFSSFPKCSTVEHFCLFFF